MPNPEAGGRVLSPDRLELVAGLLATLGALVLHVVFLFHAGALWRDEVNGVNLASLPSVSELWSLSEFDSSWLLWLLILRAWMGIGLGETDFGLRVLGFIIGMGMVGALWWNGRQFGFRVPLVSLLLVGMSSPVIRFGDAIRAYGCGTLLMLLTMGALWAAVERPSRRRILIAGAVAVSSVQCLYLNCVLLLAICAGGISVCLARGDRRTAAAVLGIGLAAALSTLPYLAVIGRAQSWLGLVQGSYSVRMGLAGALGYSGTLVYVIWLGLAAAGFLLSVRRSLCRHTGPAGAARDAALFTAASMLTGIVLYLWVLQAMRYKSFPWHFIPLMAFVAVLLDVVVHRFVLVHRRRRLAGVGLFAVGVALVYPQSWQDAHARMTNVDAVAQQLEQVVGAGDLIVIVPWYPQSTFQRYYRGVAAWTTLPELDDHRVNRYDLLKQKMMEKDAVDPILRRVAAVLRSGNRVWLVGGLPGARKKRLDALPPAPLGPQGWQEGPYRALWTQQLADLVRSRAVSLALVGAPLGVPTSKYEVVMVWVARGWR